MPPPSLNTLNCLILQSRHSLRQIPAGIQVYYINSKRRFFVYFRQLDQMLEVMKHFSQHNVRFYRRESLLPDRQQLQELAYHCNYRYKKQDLRKNLYHSTPYNEPRVHFDKYQKIKEIHQTSKEHEEGLHGEVASKPEEKDKGPESPRQPPETIEKKQNKEKQYKNEEVLGILSNRELLRQVFERMNVGM